MRALIESVPIRAPGLWVVGGAVRDHLLGRLPHELDLVVEGDAIALARELGGVVAVHERFGTATIERDGRQIDLASARAESYSQPGALPDVRLGVPIEDDLQRRDFTVNAMAVRVEDEHFTAVPGARDDLDAKRLSVLHPGSFFDDPTRMLRGARYAARLGFSLEDQILPALLRTITPSRAGTELRLALDEPQPDTLVLLGLLGLGQVLLGPGFQPEPDTIAAALELDPHPLTALAAACATDVSAALRELGFTRQEREIVAEAATLGALDGGDDVQLWRTLRHVRPQAVAAAGARGDRDAARRWLADVRHRRPAIDGNDLLAAGLEGPAIGAALDRAAEAAVAGGDRAAQLAAALGTSAP